MNELLKRRMTRKEFLIAGGLGILTLSGIAKWLKVFDKPGAKASKTPSYGIGPYGGPQTKR